MNSIPLTNVLADLLRDARDPGVMWEIGVTIAAVLLGWLLMRRLRASFAERRLLVENAGADHFVRVLGPVSVAVLLAIGRHLLMRWQPVHLLRIAVPLFASLALIRFVFYLLRRVFARHAPVSPTMLMVEKSFALLVWLALALHIAGVWPDVFQYLDETTLPLGRKAVSLAAVLQASVSVAVLLILALWAGAALEERLMQVEGLHLSLRVVLARMSRAVLILVAVLVSLSLVGIDLTVLSVFGGALGVGLGLGLQKIASNYVSGFIILLDRSLTIGDVITVDKYSGTVTQINTRYTVLQGLDGVESIVPNEMLVSGAVQNLSLSSRMLCLLTPLTVAYGTDLDDLLPALEGAAASVARVSSARAPSATLARFGADGLELQVSFWIEDPENGRGGVTSNVNRAIWRALQARGIQVPYQQREVRIIGAERPEAPPVAPA